MVENQQRAQKSVKEHRGAPVSHGDDAEDGDPAVDDDESQASSTASLTESIVDFRKIHDRTYQVSKTTEYWEPNDYLQNGGLDIMHHCLLRLFDGKLLNAPISSNPQKVLDVGTGTGIWAIDFADSFTSAEVIGVDISPIQPTSVPPNLSFQLDDVQLEWSFGADQFDYIHMRALNGSISDWSYLYRQAFHALRPDGYLEHFEFDILLRSDDPLVDSEHVFTQWAETLHYASEKMGRTLKTVKDGRMRRSMKEAGFVDIVEKKFDVPIGGWSADPKMRQAGLYALMYLDLSLEGLALFPLKQVLGWEPDQIQDFVARMRAALRDSNLKPYHQGTLVWGRKPSGKDKAAK